MRSNASKNHNSEKGAEAAKRVQDDDLNIDEILDELNADLETLAGYISPKEKCRNLEKIKARRILASFHAAEFLPLKIPDSECKWILRREKYIVNVLSFLKRPPEEDDDTARKLCVKTLCSKKQAPKHMFGNHGVFAVEDIPEGTVIEYLGVLRLSEEHDAILRKDPYCRDQFYVWDVPPIELPKTSEYGKVRLCICGYGDGNLAALVNDPKDFFIFSKTDGKQGTLCSGLGSIYIAIHNFSLVPAIANMVSVSLIWKGVPRLLYVTCRQIKAGDQLFLNYLEKADELVLDSTNEIMRWSFSAIVYKHKFDPTSPLPQLTTYLRDLIVDNEKSEDLAEKEDKSERYPRLAKDTKALGSSSLNLTILESWLPTDWRMPKREVQELSVSEEHNGSRHRKRLMEDNDEAPVNHRKRIPVRYRFVEVEDSGEENEDGIKNIYLKKEKVKQEINGKKGKKNKRSSLDDFMADGRPRQKIKTENDEIVDLEEGYSLKKVKSELDNSVEILTPNLLSAATPIEVPDEKRYAYGGKWMRSENNFDYRLSDDEEESDSDYNLGLESDSESKSDESASSAESDKMDDDSERIEDNRKANDYDSDYEGPPEDGRMYRLVNPSESQLLQIRSNLDGMWYSARIRYVFTENEERFVKVKYEGFSKAYDEIVPANAVDRFRPHYGQETSNQSRQHRMFKEIYRFSYVLEPKFAEFKDVTYQD